MASKGKAVATGKTSGGGKRKRGGAGGDDDKTGGGRKRKNREVLQFFEDAADVDDFESDDSDFDFSDNDFVDEEFDIELKVKNEPAKVQNLLFVPKEEEMDEEEFDKMMEERYKNDPRFGGFAEDSFDAKRSMERNSILPSAKDPTVWKVKCMVGRERHSAFCLMQKFVELKSLGTKLQIISAFAVDHVKGFIYIEAEKQCDINEACKGLCSIYSSRVAPVPKNEVSHMLSIQNKHSQVTEGMWARVKNGKYKGDLAQIVAVNDGRKKAMVKLIPRVDLQVLAQKFGGGVAVKTAATPSPRLISSNELEEFRPLIQYRRDRDTGKMFEVLDGLMLKDGYLYKRVSIDSLNCWGVVPSEEELLKFKPSENNESDNLEWLTQLYGAPKKKRMIGNDKGGEKGEGSSVSGMGNSFELYSLVCFGRKDFGLIVGMEKDDYYKILKHGPEAPVVMTVDMRELKNGPSDMKFTALDHCMKTISINDTVKILEGPLKDRQGIVKQIYRGIIFVYDQNETENGGYFCSKAQLCEKIKLSFDACYEKGGDSGSFGFEDFPSSPKSPLSPKRPWQARENNRDSNHGDKNGMFSIGQTLRIRVGPLKGYLCHVLAIRYSDVTVKLGSQQKVLTVKCEHLSEIRGKSSAMSASDDPATTSFKPFDLLGAEGGSGDWADGAGTSVEGDRWNAGSLSTERNSWPSVPAPGSMLTEFSPENPSSSAEAAWQKKATPNQNSSWGAAVATADDIAVANSDPVHGWGKSEECWNKAAVIGSSGGASDGWRKATVPIKDPAASLTGSGDNWGQENLKVGNSSIDDAAAWDKGKNVIGNSTSSWGDAAAVKNQLNSWSKGKDVSESGSWEKNKSSGKGEDCWNNNGAGWNQQKSDEKDDTWGKAAEAKGKAAVQEDSWGKAAEAKVKAAVQEDSWGKAAVAQGNGAVQEDCWGKAAEKWGSKDRSSESKAEWNSSACAAEKPTESWGNQGHSCNQPEAENADKTSGWMKAKVDSASQNSNWGSGKNVSEDASGWTKGGSSVHNQSDDSWNKPKVFGVDGGSSWGKPQEESPWGKQEGGSSWNKQDRDQEFGGWNKGHDGGRESFGRTGRGGGRGGRGGRGQFGRGRSYGQGQSSSWKEGGENNWRGDGTSLKNPSGWSNDRTSSGWNKFDETSAVQDDSLGKVAEKWGSKGGSSESKAEWKNSACAADKPTEGWGNLGRSWNQPEAENADKTSGWMKAKGDSASQNANWGSAKNVSEDASGWNKGGSNGQIQTDSWNKPKAFGVDGGSSWGKPQGASPWGKQERGSSWNKQGREQDFGGWNKGYDGGQGSGGRTGRDGGRGGRGQFGRGRSDGEGQSSSWKEGADNNWTGDGTSSRNPSGWSNDQACGGWKNFQNKGSAQGDSAEKPAEGWGNPVGSWNQPAAENAEKISDWMKAKGDGASRNANWGSGKNVSEDASGWTKGGSSSENQTDGWSKPKAFDVDRGSSWGKREGGSSWNKQDRDQEFGGWNKGYDGGRGSGGRTGRGGGRGGRGQFGRGRSYGEGRSSSWKEGGENNWTGDGTPSWNQSGWSNDQAGGGWKNFKDKGTAQEDSAEKPAEGWGNPGGSWNQPEAENADKTSGWMKAKGDSASQNANWGGVKNVSEDASGWNKGGSSGQNQTNSWNQPKAFGVDGGYSWGKQEGGSSWNKQDREQEFGGWNKGYDGGRGSGGRTGRGSGRGGRGQFGRGRSYGEGQSSSWKEGAENNWTGDGTSSRNPSGWSNDQAGGGWKNFQDKGSVQEDSWGKTAEKWGSKDGSSESKAEWKNSTSQAEKRTEGWGNPGGSWNQPEA